MRLHRYEVTFQYVQGSQLFIADTLSRAFLPDPGIDVRVKAMNSLLDVSDKTTQEVREATQKDLVLQFLDEGCPARKSEVPEPIRLYFDIRDTRVIKMESS